MYEETVQGGCAGREYCDLSGNTWKTVERRGLSVFRAGSTPRRSLPPSLLGSLATRNYLLACGESLPGVCPLYYSSGRGRQAAASREISENAAPILALTVFYVAPFFALELKRSFSRVEVRACETK